MPTDAPHLPTLANSLPCQHSLVTDIAIPPMNKGLFEVMQQRPKVLRRKAELDSFPGFRLTWQPGNKSTRSDWGRGKAWEQNLKMSTSLTPLVSLFRLLKDILCAMNSTVASRSFCG